jgi:cytochrome P450
MSTTPLPPGPKGNLLTGNFAELNRDWLGCYTKYARQYGDVVSYRIGPFRTALISHPTLIEKVLVTHAAKLRKSPIQHLIRPLVGDGIFLSEGEPWKRQRRLTSPPFHRQRIGIYGDRMARHAGAVVAEFAEGQTRDIYQDMTCLALRIVSNTLFDVEVGGKLADVERVLARAMQALSSRLDSPLPLPNWVPTPALFGLRKARRELDSLIDDFIAQRRGSATGNDLLSLLLAARDSEGGSGLTHQQVRDEAITLFVAGFETTAIALAWTFWLLAHHAEIASCLRSELDAVLGGRLPTSEDLPKLKYLESVVLESLRLYPPAWVFARQTLEEIEVGGFRIPKGWGVEVSQWVTQRDPRFWDQPEKFDPSRWRDGLLSRLPRFAYFPFGGGPRTCIGNAFATMEAMLVVAAVSSRAVLEPVDGASVVPEPGFTLRPKPGVHLRVARLIQHSPNARADESERVTA